MHGGVPKEIQGWDFVLCSREQKRGEHTNLKKGAVLPRQRPCAPGQVEQGRQERTLHPNSAPWCLEAARREARRIQQPRSSLEESGGVMSHVSRRGWTGPPLGCVTLDKALSLSGLLFYLIP